MFTDKSICVFHHHVTADWEGWNECRLCLSVFIIKHEEWLSLGPFSEMPLNRFYFCVCVALLFEQTWNLWKRVCVYCWCSRLFMWAAAGGYLLKEVFFPFICTYTWQANWIAQANGLSIRSLQRQIYTLIRIRRSKRFNYYWEQGDFRILNNSVVTTFAFLFSYHCWRFCIGWEYRFGRQTTY